MPLFTLIRSEYWLSRSAGLSRSVTRIPKPRRRSPARSWPECYPWELSCPGAVGGPARPKLSLSA